MKARFSRPVSKPTSVLDEVVNLLGLHGLLDLPEPYRGKMIDVCCRCIKKGRKEGRKQILKSIEQKKARDGWIEWKGGGCPVPADTRVQVRFKDGDKDECFADEYRWDHYGSDGYIIAYRVVK